MEPGLQDACVITLFFAKKSMTKTDRFAGALSSMKNQLLVPNFSGHFLLTLFLLRRRISMYISLFKVAICYRTFPVLVCACNFPSDQQACRSFFRVIYVGGPLKGPQLTTTADILIPTRYFNFIC